MATLLDHKSRPISGPAGFATSSDLVTMRCATVGIPIQNASYQSNTILVDDGASGVLVYRKEITTNKPISHYKTSTLLSLPLEMREQLYRYLLCGTETINPSMVPQKFSQVDIGFADILPGASMFLACKQLREEAKKYVYNNTHVSARWAVDSFSALQRFRWGRSMSRIESIDPHTSSITRTCAIDMSSELHTIVSKLSALKYLRISTAFLGDERDRFTLPAYGEVLFDYCRNIRACLLRFGAFVTLRHKSLKLLVWGEPIGDVSFIDLEAGAVHYTLKIMADCRDLQPTDVILNSTAIRQHTLGELLGMEAEDFKLSRHHQSSECPLAFRSSADALASRRLHHAATSGIEHMVYLTADERKRIGLSKPLDPDLLIMQARTGLLVSRFAPHHTVMLAGTALALAIKAGDSHIGTATQQPKQPDKVVASNATKDHPPTGHGTRFKRGDLMEYMKEHADYLTSMDDVFNAEELPEYLKPIEPKEKRVRRNRWKKRQV